MGDTDRLLSMRAGSTGEDWLRVYPEDHAGFATVTLHCGGGLSDMRMTLDRDEARAVRDALTAFLGD